MFIFFSKNHDLFEKSYELMFIIFLHKSNEAMLIIINKNLNFHEVLLKTMN